MRGTNSFYSFIFYHKWIKQVYEYTSRCTFYCICFDACSVYLYTHAIDFIIFINFEYHINIYRFLFDFHRRSMCCLLGREINGYFRQFYPSALHNDTFCSGSIHYLNGAIILDHRYGHFLVFCNLCHNVWSGEWVFNMASVGFLLCKCPVSCLKVELGVPSASLISSYIKGMSTSVRFWSIIPVVDCGLGCPTRVLSGGFLRSWARADSVVFVHHDSAVSIASLRDCGILPVRCAACFISCYILYVLMLCLVLFYVCMLFIINLCESCVFKVYVRFFSLLLCNNVCAC